MIESKNGGEYKQNYDVVLKLTAELLNGESLDFIGLDIGRIVDVFAFEPVDISIRAGRVDVMLRTEDGKLYHLEEQRNLKKSDLYRFAAYHFPAAKKWGDDLADIIIASGAVYAGKKELSTNSGTYKPIIIDFTERDGWKCLEKIREAAENGNFSGILELMFVPLYGNLEGMERSKLAIEVVNFERALFKQEKMDIKILAMTLVMANKILEKEKLNELWEEIKMLDIMELAHEKGKEEGLKEGRELGAREGRELGAREGRELVLKNSREMVIDTIYEKFGTVPFDIIDKINSIAQLEVLKILHRQALKCGDIEQFNEIFEKSTP